MLMFASSARPAGRPVPGHDALLALIQASLRNAGDLLGEARLLVGNGHSARAHALGTLAFEETGKAFLCDMALVPRPEPFFGLRAKGSFWAAWRDHTEKLLWAQGFQQLLIGEPGSPATQALERLIAAVSDGHLRQLRGLYVDYDGTRLLLPGDITMEEAEEVLASAESLLAVAAQAYLTDDLEERARVLIDQREDVMALLDQADQSIQADTDSAVDQFRQYFHAALGPQGAAEPLPPS